MTLREGDRPKGIEYLELSVLESTSNNDQKSKSFLRLGKLYYADKNYIKAHMWLNLAAINGHETAATVRNTFSKEMTFCMTSI